MSLHHDPLDAEEDVHAGLSRLIRFLVLATLLLAAAVRPAAAQLQDEQELDAWEGRSVAEVTWTGNSITKDYLLARAIRTAPGEPFAARTAAEDLIRLGELGVFSSTRIAIEEASDGRIRVEYQVNEMPWILPYLAFRYTEQNGWSIGPAVSSVNLAGRAIYLAGRFLVGGTTVFEALLRAPSLTETVRLEVRAAHLEREDDLNGFQEESNEIAPWITWSPTERTRIGGSIGIFTMEPDVEGLTLSGKARDVLYNVGLRLAWDSRDSFRYPTRGWYHELELFRTDGDADTWRTNLDLRRHDLLAPAHLLQLGALTTLQSGELGVDIPVYNRYFLGGANSIRGYDIDKLGPRLNGKNQMLFVAEYEWEFLPVREFRVFRWGFPIGARLAAFGDAGIAWNEEDEFRSKRFKEGGGIGLRLLVPGTNVARLDLAMGDEATIYFHFSPWSRFDRQRDRLR